MTTVLIVDDDATMRRYLRALLEDNDYCVEVAAEGHEGLAAMRAAPHPYVVLLDFLMPQFNGFDVLRAVHADAGLFARHAVIIMTAYSSIMPFDLARFMTMADIPLLRKPFEFDDVLEAVAEAEERLLM